MSTDLDVRATIGSALAGCLVGVGLSAVLAFQTFLYFQIFPADALRYKLLVIWIWLTDAVHTILICTTVWDYAIVNFTNKDIVSHIFPSVALTVAMTAIITLSVNAFYGWRIHRMSKKSWWLSATIALLSITRVGLAMTTTTEMLITKTFPVFAAHFKILFTSGLVISAVTDVIVSIARYYYLRNLRQGYSHTQEVIDAVVVFTINDGFLTCAVVIVSIACWLSMPHNFVYLGIYFTIAKLYSNSLLATLNLRNWYRHHYAWPQQAMNITGRIPPNQTTMDIPMSLSKANRRTLVPGTISIDGMNGMNGTQNKGDIEEQGATSHGDRKLDVAMPLHKRVASADLSGMPARMEVFVDRQVEYNVGNFPRGDMDTQSRSSKKSVDVD